MEPVPVCVCLNRIGGLPTRRMRSVEFSTELRDSTNLRFRSVTLLLVKD